MTASDQLYELADRAKRAEQNIAQAKSKNEAALREDVENAREASRRRAADLKAGADEAQSDVSGWWAKVQHDWSAHIAALREDVDEAKADHDLSRAQRRAKRSEGDAEAAVDYAYAALVEAEYAVLDAELARMEADVAAATR